MSHAVAAELIAAAWKEVWEAGALVSMPVEFQNHPFKRPDNVVWGRYTLLPGDTEPAALGDRMERTPFVLILQVFLPENAGTREAYQAADVMKGMDYGVKRAPDGRTVVNFRTSGLSAGVAANGFDAFNVTISGHHDTYRTA